MKKRANAVGPANEVRIIAGDYRRRLLRFPPEPGLRPTPDRVRETLFNWLGQNLDGMSALDVFAGSGALGFEAASRKAARVLMLDCNPRVVDALEANRTLLGAAQVQVIRANAAAWLKQCAESFDLVFLDPPFGSGLMAEALHLAVSHLAQDGWVYVEQDTPVIAPEGFMIHRSGNAGLSRFALLKRA
jgi:16S rRNA (guanine966-N2)-methyltransferase